MPRAPKTPKSTEMKPYIRSSTSPSPSPTPRSSDPVSQDDTSPTKRKNQPKTPKTNKAWTNEELIQLFETVGKYGAGRKTWEGAMEGRTANQCYQAWIGTVAPFLKKALANKATR